MQGQKVFKGVFTALVSPFSSSGELDMPAFHALLEWQAESGVSGFVPCGTTGENPTLSRKEWRSLVEASVQVAKKRGLSVIAGCGSNNTKEVIELIAEANEFGAEGALVVTPYYNKPNQRGLIAHYEAIAKKSSLPIVLYNVPGRTNVSITLETLRQLFQIEKIVGIKEASGNYSHWLQISKEFDLSKKALLAGDDDAFEAVLSLGGTGIISATANVAPKAFVDLYRAASTGQWDKAVAIQKQVLPLVQAMFMETNPSPAKAALAALKKCENNVRLPLVTVLPETERAIRAGLTQLGLL